MALLKNADAARVAGKKRGRFCPVEVSLPGDRLSSLVSPGAFWLGDGFRSGGLFSDLPLCSPASSASVSPVLLFDGALRFRGL